MIVYDKDYPKYGERIQVKSGREDGQRVITLYVTDEDSTAMLDMPVADAIEMANKILASTANTKPIDQ